VGLSIQPEPFRSIAISVPRRFLRVVRNVGSSGTLRNVIDQVESGLSATLKELL
jgi:hypothetical protein